MSVIDKAVALLGIIVATWLFLTRLVLSLGTKPRLSDALPFTGNSSFFNLAACGVIATTLWAALTLIGRRM